MALTEERFAGDGVNKIFTPSSTILSYNHVRVDYYKNDKPDEMFYVQPDKWDVVNNSVIFKTAPASDETVILSISTTGEDLSEPLSAVQIVAKNIDNVNTVADNIEDVKTLANSVADVFKFNLTT